MARYQLIKPLFLIDRRWYWLEFDGQQFRRRAGRCCCFACRAPCLWAPLSMPCRGNYHFKCRGHCCRSPKGVKI